MARKRIKTLASEWGFPVEDLLAGCARLKLGHTQSESSLLSPEEADRLKADLDEQAHRATILRRETVLETSSGKILEKRLNATVMRRRHAEGGQPRRPTRLSISKSKRIATIRSCRRFSAIHRRRPRRRSCSIRSITRKRRRSNRIARPSRSAVKPEPEIEEIGEADYEAHPPEAAVHLKDLDRNSSPSPKLFATSPSRSGRGRSGASA